MKKAFLTIIIVCCLFNFVACAKGSYSAYMAYERNTNKSMAMTYERFNGYKEMSFKLGEGERATVYISFVTKSGKLDAYIAKQGDKANPDFIVNDVASSTFTVDITEAGTYVIRVDGVDHSGEYNFQWEIKTAK